MSRLGASDNHRLTLPVLAVALGAAIVLVSAACRSTVEPTQGAQQPQRGGRLYLLDSDQSSFTTIDPTTLYTGTDMAFLDATLMRSLVSYTYSPDIETANTLQPDLATDTGTPNSDATQWKFTLRQGPKWQDGTPITCADIKYGISRAFAAEVFANNGPLYAIQYLDIPAETDQAAIAAGYSSAYHGPYTATADQQALFDRAVVCDGNTNTITFNLNQTVTDFNYATMWGMHPVKQSADTGLVQPTADGSPPPDFLSSGPYQIQSYTTGHGGSMILERNPHWDPASDPVRKALPDVWEVDFGLDPLVVDQRLMKSKGADAMAVMYSSLSPDDLSAVFADAHTAKPDYAGRAISAYNPYVYYLWINTQKVASKLQRQAIAVALDRESLRLNASGAFYGELADGVIPPNMGIDYAPTHLWDAAGPFGQDIPPEGNPDLARRLIAQSGDPMPHLTFDYWTNIVHQSDADIVINSLGRAGINVTATGMGDVSFWQTVADPEKASEFGAAAWGYDWPNASTIIPPMFTGGGGYNLSQVTQADSPDFYREVQDALGTLDRAAQAAKWQRLNAEAMQQAYVVPLTFGLTQTLGGTRVGPLYGWAPLASWPYAEMGVLPE